MTTTTPLTGRALRVAKLATSHTASDANISAVRNLGRLIDESERRLMVLQDFLDSYDEDGVDEAVWTSREAVTHIIDLMLHETALIEGRARAYVHEILNDGDRAARIAERKQT